MNYSTVFRRVQTGESQGEIVVGDCLDIMAQMPDGCVDLVVTDPPYGINYKSGRQGIDRRRSIRSREDVYVRPEYFGVIAGDEALLIDWLQPLVRVMAEGSAAYIFTHWKSWPALSSAVGGVSLQIKNMIVLRKSNHGMGDLQGAYAPQHELLIFATKGRHLLRFPDGRESDIWEVPVRFSGAHRRHPNEKPARWLVSAIRNSSDLGDIVADFFIGSGTTAVVADRLGRKFFGCDISEEYVAMALKRLEKDRTGRQLRFL